VARTGAEKHHQGKEVNTMKYEKPEIIVLPSALDSIQMEKTGLTLDSDCGEPEAGHTNCGYRSDE
jgi:hypothetical protein